MRFLKFAIPLTACVLFVGCTVRFSQTLSSLTLSASTRTSNAASLKAAVKELQVLEAKTKSGLDDKAYSASVSKTLPLVQQTSGNAEAVAAVKSAFKGHQLALEFWQCDRFKDYKQLHQCRGKALSGIFAKYPQIEAHAKAVIDAKDLSTLSVAVEKEEILVAIWERTSADTKAALQAIP